MPATTNPIAPVLEACRSGQQILAQPDKDEKIGFISALRTLKTTAGATLEAGLDDQVIANLVARTPNARLEEAFLASVRPDKEAADPGKPDR